jgi:hypothetical protein
MLLAGGERVDDDAGGWPGLRGRIGWAKLLARVFAIDITICRNCGGRMRVFEVTIGPDAVTRARHGACAPPRPSPPGQVLLFA